MSRHVEATPDQVLVALGGFSSALVFLAAVAVGWRLIGNRGERRAMRIVREAHRLKAGKRS